MGLLPWQNRTGIPSSMTFMITNVGREKSAEYTGDSESRVLAVLESRGSMNVTEIARNTQLPRSTVEKTIPKLVQGGYVIRSRSIDE